VAQRLAERHILVRDAGDFVGLGPSWVRVAVRTAAENDCLLAALADVMGDGAWHGRS
jgi:threonine-phosphate decarboxylase